MIRLHAGGPNRYYLCPECGAMREDVYRDRAIIAQRWHNAQADTVARAVQEEALEVLATPEGEQLELWGDGEP